MYLKRLELSGFKSFAKATTLEFPSRITAIVGPNGSGKSNIKEAIQWVLGEQSVKSLRGKRGEDLIWNGSQTVSRMGKASAALFFDNTDHAVPIDFEEVMVARKIFRDGLNEYFVNNSQVRLKDVVELAARIGLGETKHNIIGQGEVDRILLSTPRERQAMLEEALGLRVYQLKKAETERKLSSCEQNMRQVETLVREIAPHLKFLRAQAAKAEAREGIEDELKSFQKIYFAKECAEIAAASTDIASRRAPLAEKQKAVGGNIEKLRAEISDKESLLLSGEENDEEKKFHELEARRRELEREIGRLEGRRDIEKERATYPQIRAVDMRYIQDELKTFISEVRSLLDEEDRMEMARAHLLVLLEDVEALLKTIERGTVEEEREEKEKTILTDLDATIQSLQKELLQLERDIQRHEAGRRDIAARRAEGRREIRGLDTMLRALQEEERDLLLQLERLRFDDERVKIRAQTLARKQEEAKISSEDMRGVSIHEYEHVSAEELGRKIERLRGKLEEIGGIDESVIKEFQETEARYLFLTKELDDLKNAKLALEKLMGELTDHINTHFQKGFARVREEFHNYFRVIFGGGRATLQSVSVPVRGRSVDEEGEAGEESFDAAQDKETRPGIEISVELPQKRIKGLAMLSGGERALTSIALLFAITAVNPPPFLILDETDAALDEANSRRYAAILKELSKKTQLLLVTHNRETMKCAGILYGVTMGDDGVSKLLSLKFEEAEVYTNR